MRLPALRELTLRFLADETNEEFLGHLRRHESGAVWETCERADGLRIPLTGAT